MNKNIFVLLIIAILATIMYLISGITPTNKIACEFSPCPTIVKKPEQGKFCGGIAGIKCPNGFVCKYSGNYPDAGGTCVKNWLTNF